MGYFNYFIKCIIRNIAYKLCKPKVLLTVLLCIVVLLFCFKNYGYCTEVPVDGTVEIEGTVTTNPTDYDSSNSVYHQYDNQFLTLRNLQEQSQVGFINKMYILYGNSSTQANAKYFASLIMNDLLYAGGGTRYPIVFETNDGFEVGTYSIAEIEPLHGLYGYYYPYQDYVGAVHFDNVSYSGCTFSWRYMTYNNSLYPVDGVVEWYEAPSAFYNVYVENWIDMFIDFGLINSAEDNEILDKLNEIINNNQSSNIKDAIDQGNQLQQENNQIQQEQNDILTNDDVETNGLQFATDDTSNPTSDGFNTLFDTVYNAFCTTSSEPLTITLPYINETFTIHPNVVSNGMKKAGLGVVVTLISSFYYFSVCLFIYKDIAQIIDNLKSGNITSDCGNVKTEVL